uniref:Lipase maturation factor 1/2 C-terminal domain-containing protein n=1 Tax=Falco tinnunculus TaxID=100819 RepID=A0A8C4USB1_FALTI
MINLTFLTFFFLALSQTIWRRADLWSDSMALGKVGWIAGAGGVSPSPRAAVSTRAGSWPPQGGRAGEQGGAEPIAGTEITFGSAFVSRTGCYVRKVVNISFGLLIAYLSIPVVLNLLSSRQVMNTSFSPLRIVNTYGAFGSITKERTEVILQGTSSLDPNDPAAVWEEYDFKCKPGELKRRPCFITPYHYRLDWLMWFAAFQTYEQNEWIIHLAGKLLAQEEETLSLMATNPFAGRAPPRWIRAEHFKYKFSRPGGKHASEGRWWIRKRIGPYFPPVNLQGLKKFYEDRNWPYPMRD